MAVCQTSNKCSRSTIQTLQLQDSNLLFLYLKVAVSCIELVHHLNSMWHGYISMSVGFVLILSLNVAYSSPHHYGSQHFCVLKQEKSTATGVPSAAISLKQVQQTCKQCQGHKHYKERAACNCVGLNALQCEECRSFCKGYRGILPRLRRMDIADTHVLCSAARRWGRHTVNCRQNRKAESHEICILTATVHKSVKSRCYTRGYTETRNR